MVSESSGITGWEFPRIDHRKVFRAEGLDRQSLAE